MDKVLAAVYVSAYSWLVVAYIDPEDGEEVILPRYCLRAQAADGSHWEHFKMFDEEAAVLRFEARVQDALGSASREYFERSPHWHRVESALEALAPYGTEWEREQLERQGGVW